MIKKQHNIKILTIYILALLVFQQTFAQQEDEIEWGARIGISFNFGTKVNRLGLGLGLWLYNDWGQLNYWGSAYYCFNSWGPNLRKWEVQNAIGIVGSWGELVEAEHALHSPVSLQNKRPYGIAYAYIWYNDNIETSQNTGLIAIHLNSFSILSENDALIGKGTDKFRTGATQFIYRFDQTQISLSNILWTGDPKFGGSKRMKGTKYPAKFGYFDLQNAKYGKHSHGTLQLQVEHVFDYWQSARIVLGIDAEQIRHFVQNKLIHDMPFFPQKWNKAENPHYPMLDTEGNAYLFLPKQDIRAARFFLDCSLNPSLFY